MKESFVSLRDMQLMLGVSEPTAREIMHARGWRVEQFPNGSPAIRLADVQHELEARYLRCLLTVIERVRHSHTRAATVVGSYPGGFESLLEAMDGDTERACWLGLCRVPLAVESLDSWTEWVARRVGASEEVIRRIGQCVQRKPHAVYSIETSDKDTHEVIEESTK